MLLPGFAADGLTMPCTCHAVMLFLADLTQLLMVHTYEHAKRLPKSC